MCIRDSFYLEVHRELLHPYLAANFDAYRKVIMADDLNCIRSANCIRSNRDWNSRLKRAYAGMLMFTEPWSRPTNVLPIANRTFA